jgi:hypothetical protein
MAKTYTYEDFEKALAASGLGGQFSEADLRLARQNPDAGMSILTYKQDYNNATTDEARALANAGANAVRESFGEYTAGADGSGFYKTMDSPGSFSYNEPAPTYNNTYGQQADSMLSEILNRKDFSYDHTTDPLYSSYKKTYTREGKRATADALGEAAAATGGIPSSYAVSAASQAGNNHVAKLADKVPELYEMAYNKYLQEYQMKFNDYEALQNRDQFEYSKYLDELSQYEANKNFDYAQWLDELDARAKEATRIANERSAALSEAYAAAEYGDFSKLEALGVNPDFEYLAQLSAGKNSNTTADTSISVGGIPADIVTIINNRYPGGVVTDANVWNELVTEYGEEALKDAGITKSFMDNANVLDVTNNPILNRLPNELNTGESKGAWTTAKINDVYGNVAILIDMMNEGDDVIKTVDDVKNAIIEAYPRYANDAYFATILNEMILELTKKTPSPNKSANGGGGGKINRVSMSEVQ